MSTVLETTLVRTADICGGRLRIDGTRMTVNQIVYLHKQGFTPEGIVEQYPQLSVREVYAVLAWYHDHREDFDAELDAEEAADRAAYETHLASRQLAESGSTLTKTQLRLSSSTVYFAPVST